MTLSPTLLLIGGALFALMGGGHGLLTLYDVFRPRYFTPIDDSVREAMQGTGVRFSGGHANMWKAWLGFNLSHSLGAFLFGLAACWLGLHPELLTKSVLLIPLAIGAVYLLLAVRFWFYGPSLGCGLATFCFLLSWLLSA